MKLIFFLLFGLGVCICPGAEPHSVTATVIPEVLNIRSAPARASRIISTLRAGESVTLLSPADGEWCRIAMPENASVWIAAAMVNADGIPLPDALFRSGPGAAYEEIGRAAPEKIEIRETAKNGRWLRVKPQKGLVAYVSTAYLKIAEEKNAPASSRKKTHAPEKRDAPEPIRESAVR